MCVCVCVCECVCVLVRVCDVLSSRRFQVRNLNDTMTCKISLLNRCLAQRAGGTCVHAFVSLKSQLAVIRSLKQ